MIEKKRNLDDQLKLKQRKLADDENLIDECCKGKEFETHLKALEEKVSTAQVIERIVFPSFKKNISYSFHQKIKLKNILIF